MPSTTSLNNTQTLTTTRVYCHPLPKISCCQVATRLVHGSRSNDPVRETGDSMRRLPCTGKGLATTSSPRAVNLCRQSYKSRRLVPTQISPVESSRPPRKRSHQGARRALKGTTPTMPLPFMMGTHPFGFLSLTKEMPSFFSTPRFGVKRCNTRTLAPGMSVAPCVFSVVSSNQRATGEKVGGGVRSRNSGGVTAVVLQSG